MWKVLLTLGLLSLVRAVRFYRANRTLLGDLAKELEACKTGFKKVSLERNELISDLDRSRRASSLASQRADKAEAEIPRIQEERNTSYKLVEELKASKVNLRRERDAANERAALMYSIATCECAASRVLRKFPDYGYVQRVHKAIMRGEVN